MLHKMYTFVLGLAIVSSLSMIIVVFQGYAQTEQGPLNQLPLYTKVFNKILYGVDMGKTASEMITTLDAGQTLFNAGQVCEGTGDDSKCYTWDAFLDRNLHSVPISLSDITRIDDTGVNISGPLMSCGVNEAVGDIDEESGSPACKAVRQCYYSSSGTCVANYSAKGYNICCSF